jgi:hypothetical protein
MSGYLVQSRKHVTTLVVEEMKMFGYQQKAEAALILAAPASRHQSMM